MRWNKFLFCIMIVDKNSEIICARMLPVFTADAFSGIIKYGVIV